MASGYLLLPRRHLTNYTRVIIKAAFGKPADFGLKWGVCYATDVTELFSTNALHNGESEVNNNNMIMLFQRFRRDSCVPI